jgi:hypothetical protein
MYKQITNLEDLPRGRHKAALEWNMIGFANSDSSFKQDISSL